MGILFLVALVLAWPTAGISVVAYVAFAVSRNYLANKVRAHDANIHAARRSFVSGEKRLPSWVNDNAERQIFIEVIKQKAIRDGVPEAWLMAHLRDNETFMKYVHFAGAMEHHGSSFTEQQAAVSDEISKIWKLVPSPMTDMQRSTTKASPQSPSNKPVEPKLLPMETPHPSQTKLPKVMLKPKAKVDRDAYASNHPKSFVSKKLLSRVSKANDETTEVARLRNLATQGDNPAQRLINDVKNVTDIIDARYPARRSGPPDTTETITEDAALAIFELDRICADIQKARAHCDTILEVEHECSKTAFTAFVGMVEKQLQDASLEVLQVQTRIMDAVNRMVLLHSNSPEGESKQALNEFVALNDSLIRQLNDLRAHITDDIEQVVTPAMRRAKGHERNVS